MTQPTNWYNLTGSITDVSTADSVRFVVPAAGFLRKVQTVLGAAITVANSTVTVRHNGTALTPTITITQAGSAEGDVDSAEFYRGVAAGDYIEVETDGGSTTTARLDVNVTLSG